MLLLLQFPLKAGGAGVCLALFTMTRVPYAGARTVHNAGQLVLDPPTTGQHQHRRLSLMSGEGQGGVVPRCSTGCQPTCVSPPGSFLFTSKQSLLLSVWQRYFLYLNCNLRRRELPQSSDRGSREPVNHCVLFMHHVTKATHICRRPLRMWIGRVMPGLDSTLGTSQPSPTQP